MSLLSSVAPRRPGWRRHLTFGLLLGALTVLSVGVAQPTAAVRVPRDRATVMLAIDVSLSMQASDVLPTRIQAAIDGAKSFVDELPARINIGLVKFSGATSVLVPPTVDRDSVNVALDHLQPEDSAAIGEAVFTCLDAIRSFAAATTASGDAPPPARIVLMSDGGNNKGRSLAEAAAAARRAQVPVSTIAFGTDSGTITLDGETVPVPADRPALRGLAAGTGGSFHTAASAEELKSVYTHIGSQIGYTTTRRDISWRFLATGTLLALTAAATSLLWSGRIT